MSAIITNHLRGFSPSLQLFDPLIRRVSLISAVALLIFAGCRYIKECYNQRVVDRAANAILLTFWPNNQNLPEAKLEEKAKLIQQRIRVMSALKEKIDHNRLSKEHRKILLTKWDSANWIFFAVDNVRTTLPSEVSYRNASTLDKIFEDRFIKSIILSYKPAKECNFWERRKKSIQLTRSRHIQKEVLKKIEQMELYSAIRFCLPTIQSKIIQILE